MILALLLTSFALADELIPVRSGDSVESIATDLGDPNLASVIREMNGLGPTEALKPGDVLRLPDLATSSRQTATLMSIVGTVFGLDPNRAVTPLSLCDPIPSEIQVCTGPDGYATVRLAAASAGQAYDDLNLVPNSCLRVGSSTSTDGERRSVVELESGGLAVRSGDDSGEVGVVTASGVTVGDRGAYRVAVESDSTRTESLEGGVAVAGGGTEVSLEAGQGVAVESGQAPGPVVTLLAAPGLTGPPDAAVLFAHDFAWTDVPFALSYRIEVASAQDFSEVLHSDEVDGVAYSPDVLFLPQRPTLWWRVSSFDRGGFQGIPSSPRRLTVPGGGE